MMTIEPFVYLLLFLIVGLAVMFARWLRTEIEKGRIKFNGEPVSERIHDDLKSANRPDESEKVTLAHVEPTQNVSPAKPATHSLMVRGKWNRHVRTSSTLGQGIVLMTILGPCRALDQRNNFPNI